jgi:hypothetical protein
MMRGLRMSAPLSDEQVNSMGMKIEESGRRLEGLDVSDEIREDILAMIRLAGESLDMRWPAYCIEELIAAIGDKINAVCSGDERISFVQEVAERTSHISTVPPSA